MAGSGRGLMMAGLIVMFVGLCIILVRVLHVPEYWVPLMVGAGLFLLGVLRWLGGRGDRGPDRPARGPR